MQHPINWVFFIKVKGSLLLLKISTESSSSWKEKDSSCYTKWNQLKTLFKCTKDNSFWVHQLMRSGQASFPQSLVCFQVLVPLHSVLQVANHAGIIKTVWNVCLGMPLILTGFVFDARRFVKHAPSKMFLLVWL